MRRYCCAFGCSSNSIITPELTFFSMPTDQGRRVKWQRILYREDLMNRPSNQYYVCELHFHPGDILKSTNRKILKQSALPSQNLPSGFAIKTDKEVQAEVQTSNALVQTVFWKSANYTQTRSMFHRDNIRKKKLQNELSTLKKELKLYDCGDAPEKSQKNLFHKLCERFLSEELAGLIKAQTNLKFHGKGNRYPLAYKILFLNLYHVSPQAYGLLEKAFFLPCRNTLNKLYVPVTTEVNEDLLSALKVKVTNMSDIEKQCSVVLDSISLKCSLYYNIKKDKIIGFHEVDGVQSPRPAKYGLVLAVQGLFVNWMQPIGFALLSEYKINDDAVINWIDKILEKLLETGLKIRNFISDIDQVLLNVAEKKHISVDKPYFFINNLKIYYIFDSLHLIKQLRNDFMKYHFIFDNNFTAKFDHIRQFYEYDKIKSLRLAEKLTDNHINPKKSDKTKISYAMDLFSKSVAAGISMYVDHNAIDSTGTHTVNFIDMMNNLFEALNSSSPCEDDAQIMFLYNMLNFFYSLKLVNPKNGIDVTQTTKFIQGFQITIKSILVFIEDLKQEGYKRLPTNRLNQNALKSFFDKIRSNDCIGMEPTPRQFVPAFHKMYFAYMLKRSRNGRADDPSKFLIKLNEINTSDNESQIDENEVRLQPNQVLGIPSTTYRQIIIPDQNAFLYISEFLLKKSAEQHNTCDMLSCYIQNIYNINQNVINFNFHQFINYVESMENIFREYFKTDHINIRVGSTIYDQMKMLCFSPPCPCFPVTYLHKLFIRMRIFLSIKHNNKEYRKHRIKKEKYFAVNNF